MFRLFQNICISTYSLAYLLHLNEYLVDTRIGYLVCSLYWEVRSIIISGVELQS